MTCAIFWVKTFKGALGEEFEKGLDWPCRRRGACRRGAKRTVSDYVKRREHRLDAVRLAGQRQARGGGADVGGAVQQEREGSGAEEAGHGAGD